MNAKDQPSSFFDTVIKLFSDYFSNILKISGILYFFGFIITRSHLLNYGITEIDLLQTKYISVGLFFIINVAIVWLPFIIRKINEDEEEKLKEKIAQSTSTLASFLILLFVIIVFAVDLIAEPKYIFIGFTLLFGFLSLLEIIIFKKPNISLFKVVKVEKSNILLSKRIIFTIIRIVIGILVAHVFLYLSLSAWNKTIDVNIFNLFTHTQIKNTLKDYIDDYYSSLKYIFVSWYLSLLIIGYSLYLLMSKKVNTDSKNVLFVQLRYWLIAIITIFSLFDIQKYSNHIYPLIPANLGGGQPTRIELLLSKEGNDNFNIYKQTLKDQAPLKLKDKALLELKDEERSKLKSVCLIAQTSEYYYISPCFNIGKIVKNKNNKFSKNNSKMLHEKLKRFIDSKKTLDPSYEKAIEIKKSDVLTIVYQRN
ncbi:hypothetical protein [Planktothrix paucivesiculata]|uniref:Uncharacterized protein n=1 Tax=Planktothrix paucivesiculata PCC 9631 TaxID=671071 RepID=A0A7Z9DU79_9CYAN|nr:hypothetical protein [Planktothrix paucivesiculata]VXD10371.1 membrane hypothetical protein [Planktothrix paucivesiculata PCC 9631]